MKNIEVFNTLTLAQCVEQLFGIELAKFTSLKDQLNSFVRNELIESRKTEKVSHAKGGRSHTLIPVHQLDKIFNAIVLNGIFDDPKLVKNLFQNKDKRRDSAVWVNELFLNRQSVIGVALLKKEVLEFLHAFSNLDFDLAKQRLPNPFERLPQVVLGDKTSIMQSLLARSASLSQGDNMMKTYLNDDLKKAWEYAQNLQTDQPVLLQYKALVEKEYLEAVEFEKTLKDLDF